MKYITAILLLVACTKQQLSQKVYGVAPYSGDCDTCNDLSAIKGAIDAAYIFSGICTCDVGGPVRVFSGFGNDTTISYNLIPGAFYCESCADTLGIWEGFGNDTLNVWGWNEFKKLNKPH